ncbi:uncharacterized protein LOC116208813 [Punica granatum]|uniref:Uncharacterized protein LOC116208813 n=1 Tax=Punica granatum TaxID=22663 RepID=A0A218XC93_PUNGR|nr:uncharacterized protein LOC116208813 [Punica granatum]XP_031398234.1 uncharacterized protein LOC116208813 [Punica granatum]OWM82326.1 hypothetical protein CDL15_Pgr001900 [Punica granatum]
MDAYSHSLESDSDDCDSFGNRLGNNLDKVLKIRDVHGKRWVSDEDDDSEDEVINAFGRHRKMFDDSSTDEEAGEAELSRESLRKVYELAMALPSPANLVSAMKGSRERAEQSQKNLTVTWAPDVYDPPPTQLELILSRGTKQQKLPKKEKKSGKKAQKGKDFSRGGSSGKESSRGSSRDKTKKQHRGFSGGSRRYNMFADGDDDDMESFSSGVPDSAFESKKDSSRWGGRDKKKQTCGMGGNFRRYDLPPSDDDDDDEEQEVKAGKVEAGSPDSHCGSSFLKGSLKELHHSVAKAL